MRVAGLLEPLSIREQEVLGLLLDSGIRPGAPVRVWVEDETSIVEALDGVAGHTVDETRHLDAATLIGVRAPRMERAPHRDVHQARR